MCSLFLIRVALFDDLKARGSRYAAWLHPYRWWMAAANAWRPRKVQAEISKLGIRVSLATISPCFPKAEPDPGSQRHWRAFLRNHRDLIAAMDFFVGPTIRFQLLCFWFAIDHGRRRVLHFNVTADPTFSWVVQRLRGAFPESPAHRYLIFDNDTIFSPEVARSIRRFGIHPTRTTLQSPWENGTAERLLGSVRRELLDHAFVLGEDHLRHLLRKHVAYYDRERVHTSIGDSPEGRTVQGRPSSRARIVAFPHVGGLHHRYAWAEAA